MYNIKADPKRERKLFF